MWSTIAVLSVVALVCCEGRISYRDSKIVRQTNLRDPNTGGYDYSYETSDGTRVEQSGVPDPVSGAITMFGSYEWKDPFTQQVYVVQYIADENGFQPLGMHIPRSAGVRAS